MAEHCQELEQQRNNAAGHVKQLESLILTKSPAAPAGAEQAAAPNLQIESATQSAVSGAQLCSADKAQALICEIRAARLIGSEVPAHLVAGTESLRGMCARALEKLSKDIYNSRSHFISEILQNCDDNKYQADAVASLTIHVVRAPRVPTQVFLTLLVSRWVSGGRFGDAVK